MFTFLFHSRPEALSKATEAALVALVLVDDAVAIEAANVDVVLAHRTPKEPLAAVTRRRTVVLTRRPVAADIAELQRLQPRRQPSRTRRRRRRRRRGCSRRGRRWRYRRGGPMMLREEKD